MNQLLFLSTFFVLNLLVLTSAHEGLRAQMEGRASFNPEALKNPLFQSVLSKKDVKAALQRKKENGASNPMKSEQTVTGATGANDPETPKKSETGATGANDPEKSQTGATGANDPETPKKSETGATGANDPETPKKSHTGATGANDPETPKKSETGATGTRDPESLPTKIKNPIEVHPDVNSDAFKNIKQRELDFKAYLESYIKKGDQQEKIIDGENQEQKNKYKECLAKGIKCRQYLKKCNAATENERVFKKECCPDEIICEPKEKPYDFIIAGINVDRTITYQLKDYSKDDRPLFEKGKTVSDGFKQSVGTYVKLYGLDKEAAITTECLKLNLIDAKSILINLARALNLTEELEKHCPYYHALTHEWKYDGVRPIDFLTKLNVDGTETDQSYGDVQVQELLGGKKMKDSECQGNNPEPKDGSMVQCLLCAMEDIIRRRQRSTQQEARLQLKLAHYLLDLKQDYNNYKMCYETALSCASSPIYNHDSKSPRPTSPPISAGTFCQYENVGRRDICPITTIVHLEKLLHKTPMSDYCTRLDRIDQVQYELFDFLSGAKLDSESNMCEPPKHMDLTKENGIDFIVDVVDRDTGKTPETMLFEIDPDPVTGELFLSPDDITYDSKKGLLNVVYDCRESGAGYMRCHFSLSKEHCKSVKTTNFVRAYDENNRFIERCSVTVQGLHFSILCDSEKTSDQDIGDRRMKLVEYRQSTVFWANQQREKYNQILHARGGSRRRLLARAAGVKEGC